LTEWVSNSIVAAFALTVGQATSLALFAINLSLEILGLAREPLCILLKGLEALLPLLSLLDKLLETTGDASHLELKVITLLNVMH
jgi:hypothetical protein